MANKKLHLNNVPRGASGSFEITQLNLEALPTTSPIKAEGFLTPGFEIRFVCKKSLDDPDERAVFIKSSSVPGQISPITIDTAYVNLSPEDTKDVVIPKRDNQIRLYYTVEFSNTSRTIVYKAEEQNYFYLLKTAAGE